MLATRNDAQVFQFCIAMQEKEKIPDSNEVFEYESVNFEKKAQKMLLRYKENL